MMNQIQTRPPLSNAKQMKRGPAGFNLTKPNKKAAVVSSNYGPERAIKVPKKYYDLNNLGPDAYPPGYFEEQNAVNDIDETPDIHLL